MPDTIHTKAKMYRYLKSGRLGNTAKIYTNIHDIPDTEIVGVRYAEVSSMGRCIYGISKQKLHTIDLTNAVISEYPQSKASVVLNAEIMNSTNGIYLRY